MGVDSGVACAESTRKYRNLLPLERVSRCSDEAQAVQPGRVHNTDIRPPEGGVTFCWVQ
jgi:hypothetical protein